MRKVRSLLLFIGMCILLSTGVGCIQKGQPTIPEAKQKTSEESILNTKQQDDLKIKIGISYQNLKNEFIHNIQEAIKKRAQELNIELIETDGQGRAENQIAQVEKFIARRVNVIILNPYSIEDCKPAVEAANRANIPILTVNNMVANQDKCVTFVGSDAVESGRIQMEYVAKRLGGKGNIVVLHGPIGHDAEVGRRKGTQEILDKNPDIKVLYEQSGNWSRDEAQIIMEVWLRSGEQIDAVVAQNDEMALGAVKAIEDDKNDKDILVFGIDAIPDALEAINNGKMAGTVFQDAMGQGSGVIEAAVMIANGLKVDKNIFIPYALVTKDNLSEYITMKDN